MGNKKEEKKQIYVLSREGKTVSESGANLIRSSLHLDEDTDVLFGSYFNNPAFLAGALAQNLGGSYLIAIDDNKTQGGITGKKDLSYFVKMLMKESGNGKTSFEIFMEEVVPHLRK